MTRPVHPLGFKTAGLPFNQLAALVECLETVGDVLSGLQEQPRFGGDGEPCGYNEAGEMLETLRNNIGCEVDDIRAEVDDRPVADTTEAQFKFGILIGRYTGGCDDPMSAVSELALLAVRLGCDLKAVKS